MKYFAILIITFALVGCKKAEDRRCMKSAGVEKTVERTVEPFYKLFIGPNLNVVLVQDTVEKLVITAGENLIGFVTSDVIDGQLRIENTNRCNFLRSFKKQVSVEIHLKNLKELYFEGTKPIQCANQLVLGNLEVIIRDGAGTVNLNVQCNALRSTVTNGWGNLVLSGETNFLWIELNSNGFSQSYGLDVHDSLYLVSKTSGNIEVNSNGAYLRSEVSSNGDILYKGIPTLINNTVYGSGALIDNN